MCNLHWSLSVSIMWRALDVEIFREVGRLIRSEINIRIQVWINLRCGRLEFVSVRLTVRTRVTDAELIFNSNSEAVVFERNEISHFTSTAAYTGANRLPVALGQFKHFNLVSNWESRGDRDRWFPAKR